MTRRSRPGSWTVDRGHALADDVETAIRQSRPDTTVQTNIEPRR